MINTYNSCINSFYKKYYNVFDQLDTKVGRRATIAIDFFAPTIIPLIAFCPGLLLYAYDNDIEKKLIIITIIVMQTIAYLGMIIVLQKRKETYRKEEIERTIIDSHHNSKKALIIETADWSGGAPSSYTHHIPLFPSMGDEDLQVIPYRFNILHLARTHSIQHITAYSEVELNENLERLKNKTIDFLWIRGHGNQQGIYFNKNFFFNKASTSIKIMAKKLRQPALCISGGCRTGQGESNIAKTLSTSFPGTVVYAPKDVASIVFQEFAANLSPIFYASDWRKKVVTASYYAGVESSS